MSESPTTGLSLPETVGVTRSGKLHLINRASVDDYGPLRAACNRTVVVDPINDLDDLNSTLQRRTLRHLTSALRIQESRGRLLLSSRIVCANCDSAVRRELKS